MADDEVRSEGIERRPIGLYDSLVLPVLGELVGVTCYVFVSLMVPECPSEFPQYFCRRAISEGLAIAALMVTFGQLSGSGGHFNPAVTLGVLIAGGINPVAGGIHPILFVFLTVVFYIKVQIIGGILGAALARAILQDDFGMAFWRYRNSYPNAGWQFFGEFLLTGMWVFVFLMTVVRDNGKEKKLAPIAVGFTVLVGKLASYKTGGDMNTVVSFGKSVVSSGVSSLSIFISPWKDHYIFWLGPLLGGTVIALIYRLLFASSNRRWLFKSRDNQFANI